MRTDYLKWDAESIQELLRRKLTESGLYTDQLYPGSDTKILIDLFAWTFDVLTYIMNNAAADSLFDDTQLYENLNRIVKLLSYNPHGYLTSSTQFKINANPQLDINAKTRLPDTCTIPMFTSIDTGKTDIYGNSIKYSFVEDFTFNVYTSINGTTYTSQVITPKTWPTLYNGEFKKYFTLFVSSGIPYEVFTLTGVNPNNEESPIYIDHNNFHVYVEKIDESTGERIITEYTRVDNLILEAAYNDTVYELRLNENKEYTIKFGDNIHGKKLEAGSKIHVIYLQSNGEYGKIDAGEVLINSLTLNISGFESYTEFLNVCFNGFDHFKQNYASLFINNGLFIQTCNKLQISNIDASSEPQTYETIESIKENAPSAFRIGGRLVTESDYETYIMQNYGDRIHDIWVCNNATYCTLFYQWLKKYNQLNIDIRKYYYRYADACDFNNIYLWLKSSYSGNVSDSDLSMITDDCNRIKSATVELVPCNAIETYFIPFVDHPTYKFDINETKLTADWKPPVKIVIEKKPNTYVNNEQIKEQINKIIIDYFSLNVQTLGNIINISELYKQLINLGYIESIKTVNIPEDDPYNTYSVDGLSFACFSPTPVNGKDFEIFTHVKKLQPFQFAVLYTDTLINLIEIENDDTFNVTNTGF